MTETPKHTKEICEAGDFVLRLKHWLENPEFHLSDQTRTDILELLVQNHVEAVKRDERAKVRNEMFRNRGKDIILLGAVVTLLSSYGPTVVALFTGFFQ